VAPYHCLCYQNELLRFARALSHVAQAIIRRRLIPLVWTGLDKRLSPGIAMLRSYSWLLRLARSAAMLARSSSLRWRLPGEHLGGRYGYASGAFLAVAGSRPDGGRNGSAWRMLLSLLT